MVAFRKFRLLVLVLLVAIVPVVSHAGVFVNISIAPPLLPVYVQPPCPQPGYIWTPGYWAYGPMGYYWVPGAWVMAPAPGLLWTPGYWGVSNGFYVWHTGYWGPRVGFYGGVNYGYGYPGEGFYGGRWVGNNFAYNTAVVNVNRNVIHNTYVQNTVIRNTAASRASYNGPGGISARPNRQQQQAYNQRRLELTTEQTQHRELASRNRQNPDSNNSNRPAMTSVKQPARNNFNQPQNRQRETLRAPQNRPAPRELNRPATQEWKQQNLSRSQGQYRESEGRPRQVAQRGNLDQARQWSAGNRQSNVASWQAKDPARRLR